MSYSDHSDSEYSEEPIITKKAKRRKRCQVDPTLWADQRNALNPEKAKRYNGRKKEDNKWKKIPKQDRKLKQRCKCGANKTMKCAEIPEVKMKEIFDLF